MEKEQLIETEQKFYEQLKNKNDVDEILSLYQRFWNWLVEEAVDDCKTQWRLMRSVQRIIKIYNVKCKEYSTSWNPLIVAKVGDFCFKFREKMRNPAYQFSQDKPMQVMFGFLMKDLLNEKDFLTVAYCASVLKYSKLLVEMD